MPWKLKSILSTNIQDRQNLRAKLCALFFRCGRTFTSGVYVMQDNHSQGELVKHTDCFSVVNQEEMRKTRSTRAPSSEQLSGLHATSITVCRSRIRVHAAELPTIRSSTDSLQIYPVLIFEENSLWTAVFKL